jgi:hypothetical protein
VLIPVRKCFSYLAYIGYNSDSTMIRLRQQLKSNNRRSYMGIVRERIRYIANQELGSGNARYLDNYHDLDKYFKETGKSQYGADQTTSWCGLFSCWVLKQAGVQVKWGINQFNSYGIVNLGSSQVELVDASTDKGKGIRPGDVGVIKHRIHHFIVEYAYENCEALVTIDGNYLGRKSDCIQRSYEHTRSGLWYYYRLLVD